MALSALSLDRQEGRQCLDALQHYDQALPSLKSTMKGKEDLSSDGPFLTHFLLLIYEVISGNLPLQDCETDWVQILAADQGASNLWSGHLEHLLRITLLRHDRFGHEPYPHLIWWLCVMDVYASLSGTGHGEYIHTLLANNLVPSPKETLHLETLSRKNQISQEEFDLLYSISAFQRKIVLLAARVGRLAGKFRNEESQERSVDGDQGVYGHDQRMLMGGQVSQLQEELRRSWATEKPHWLLDPDWLSFERLPRQAQVLLNHTYTLYRVCLIYSHTSMWSSQRLDTDGDAKGEIDRCVSELLRQAQFVVDRQRYEFKWIICALFMAGFAASSTEKKMLALDLIRSLENEDVGRNAMIARYLLQEVHERQNQNFVAFGHSFHVDWMDVMAGTDLRIITFTI
ncbi:MAG: hypothetical protein M1819_004358 [Sarea resinae]|nr:MAG: hypothetical protein M1819_004358 [Sarea resinae]